MPALGIHGTHPTTGVKGIWVQLADKSILGIAASSYPSTGGKTRTQYQTLLRSAIAAKNIPADISVTVTVLSMNPLSIQTEVTDA